MLRLLAMGAAILALCFACSRQSNGASGAAQVRIAAAASLKPVLPEIIAAFTAMHPTITATPTYGASGTFHTQILNGAPFDVFLSADMKYPKELQEAGLTDGPVREYASGRLVIWTLKTSGLNVDSLNTLTDDRVKKVSLANPELAPYGRAAESALKAAGVYDSARAKLVYGESVEQAATFARTGAADVGILPRSQIAVPAMAEVGVWSDVPAGLYEPIRHGAVLLKSARDAAAAREFLDFLAGPESRAILEKGGLGP